MAENVQIARYSEVRRRVLSLKGNDALSVDSHVQPCYQLDDLSRPEFRGDSNVANWSRAVIIGAVAAQFPIVQIIPPAGGDRLFVIEGIIVQAAAAGDFAWGFANQDTAGVSSTLNTRHNNVPNSAPWLSNGTLAAVANPAAGRVTVAANQSVMIGSPFFPLMQSNDAGLQVFKVTFSVVNTAVQITLCGYDRASAESEF